MRAILTRLLLWSVIAALLLPVALGVVLGLSALLAALGDVSAAVICQRSGLVIGVLWFVALVATAVTSGIVAIEAAGRDRSPEDHEG